MIDFQIAKRFCIFLPALARIEEYCIRKGLHPQTHVLNFVQHIKPRDGAERLAGEQLDELKDIGVSFVETNYATEKSIRRWSRGMFDDYYWEQAIGKNKDITRESLIKDIRKREAFYVRQAEEYASCHALK